MDAWKSSPKSSGTAAALLGSKCVCANSMPSGFSLLIRSPRMILPAQKTTRFAQLSASLTSNTGPLRQRLEGAFSLKGRLGAGLNTLVSASTLDAELKANYGGNKDAAKAVGALIAKRALEAGISEVVFDRGGYVYHGRVAELAAGARENGLKF